MKSIYLSIMSLVCLVSSHNITIGQNLVSQSIMQMDTFNFACEDPVLNWTDTGSTYTIDVYECSPDLSNIDTFGLDKMSLVAGPISIALIPDDLSGLTFNEQTNTLFGITNGATNIYEFDLNGNVLRTISLTGFNDTEALTWIGGQDFAVVEERRGRVVKITITAATTTIAYASTIYLQLPGSWGNNLGLEGVNYNPCTNEISVIKEKSPMAIYTFPADFGMPISVTNPFDFVTNNFGFTDISGLHHLGSNDAFCEMNVSDHFLVLSHESQALIETDATGVEYSRLDLSNGGANGTLATGLAQAEGITVDNQGNVYVVSEPNTFYKFSNAALDVTPLNSTTPVYTNPSATGSTLSLPQNIFTPGQAYCWSIRDNNLPDKCPDYATFLPIDKGLDLEIFFDGFPAQTSWDIQDSNGLVVASSTGYTSSNAIMTINETICLSTGCYTLNFYDSLGNGMCPFKASAASSGIFITPGTFLSSGSVVATLGSVVTPGLCGTYILTDNNGTTLATGGGNFGIIQSSPFCVSP